MSVHPVIPLRDAAAELKDRRVPILFFANKMDIAGCLTPYECSSALKLEDIRAKPYHIQCVWPRARIPGQCTHARTRQLHTCMIPTRVCGMHTRGKQLCSGTPGRPHDASAAAIYVPTSVRVTFRGAAPSPDHLLSTCVQCAHGCLKRPS